MIPPNYSCRLSIGSRPADEFCRYRGTRMSNVFTTAFLIARGSGQRENGCGRLRDHLLSIFPDPRGDVPSSHPARWVASVLGFGVDFNSPLLARSPTRYAVWSCASLGCPHCLGSSFDTSETVTVVRQYYRFREIRGDW